MTDGQERQPVRDENGPNRTRLFVGGALAAVLLAVIGASTGWVLAGESEPPYPARRVHRPPTPAPRPPSRPNGRAEDRPTSTPPTRPAGLTVPKLVGADFEQAREELRDLGSAGGWCSGAGAARWSTSPSPGAPVKRGVTVVVWVAGPAPADTVPDLDGRACSDAADELVDAGFSPRYRTGPGRSPPRSPPGALPVGTTGRQLLRDRLGYADDQPAARRDVPPAR